MLYVLYSALYVEYTVWGKDNKKISKHVVESEEWQETITQSKLSGDKISYISGPTHLFSAIQVVSFFDLQIDIVYMVIPVLNQEMSAKPFNSSP